MRLLYTGARAALRSLCLTAPTFGELLYIGARGTLPSFSYFCIRTEAFQRVLRHSRAQYFDHYQPLLRSHRRPPRKLLYTGVPATWDTLAPMVPAPTTPRELLYTGPCGILATLEYLRARTHNPQRVIVHRCAQHFGHYHPLPRSRREHPRELEVVLYRNWVRFLNRWGRSRGKSSLDFFSKWDMWKGHLTFPFWWGGSSVEVSLAAAGAFFRLELTFLGFYNMY